jgi:adenylate kinase family enzyme
VVFFGCSPGEVCQELGTLGHGIFTYSFIEAAKTSPAIPLLINRRVNELVQKLCSENKLSQQRPYTSVFPIEKAIIDLFTGRPIDLVMGGPKVCILVAGPSIAGKSTLGKYLASTRGCVHIEMSSFAYQRYQQSNFNGSIQEFMEEVVWVNGDKAVIANDLLASQPGLDRVVITGPRTVEEIEVLRSQDWQCATVFLYASSTVRFDRWRSSRDGRYVDRYAAGYNEFVLKDLREYGWGLAKIATLPRLVWSSTMGRWSPSMTKFKGVSRTPGRPE